MENLETKNKDRSTFPTMEANEHVGLTGKEDGLTKREYFAGLAMQGYCGGEFTGQSGMPTKTIAKWAVKMADDLLVELSIEGVK